MASSPDLSPSIFCGVVLPTFREAGNLETLLPRLWASLKTLEKSCKVVIVDDNSRDGTTEIVRSARDAGVDVSLIVRQEERGLSSAVLAGFNALPDAAYLVCMDADWSHPPEKIPEMLRELLADPSVDFVIASRYVPGGSTCVDWGFRRWFYSQSARILSLPIVKLQDPLSGFFALPRGVYDRACDIHPLGYKIGLELIVKCHCRRTVEVPFHFSSRLHGQSKLTLKQQFLYVVHVVRLVLYRITAHFRHHQD